MDSAAVAIVSLSIIIAAVGVALRLRPSLLRFVALDPRGRNASLDGLRGLLALSVFIHHGFIMRAYRAGEPWGPPDGHLENLLGVGSVALFFMASAFLFWARVVDARGHFDWIRFFCGRVLRIFPMYLAAVAFLFAIVAFETGFTLREPLGVVVKESASWLTFNFRPLRDINGFQDTTTILSVLWSLRFEWVLYLSLPVAALIYWRTGSAALIYGAVLLLAARGGGLFYLAAFAAGGLAVHLTAWRRDDARIDAAFSIAGLLALATLVERYRFVDGFVQTGLLLVVFVAALRPWGVFRFLRIRPMLYLGQISFSVYLLHNPILHLATAHVVGAAAYASLPVLNFILFDVTVGLAVVALSTLTFHFIERPFIDYAARPLATSTAGWPRWLQPRQPSPRRWEWAATKPAPASLVGGALGGPNAPVNENIPVARAESIARRRKA